MRQTKSWRSTFNGAGGTRGVRWSAEGSSVVQDLHLCDQTKHIPSQPIMTDQVIWNWFEAHCPQVILYDILLDNGHLLFCDNFLVSLVQGPKGHAARDKSLVQGPWALKSSRTMRNCSSLERRRVCESGVYFNFNYCLAVGSWFILTVVIGPVCQEASDILWCLESL